MKIKFKNGSCIEEIRADSKPVRGKRALLYPLVFDYEKSDPEELNEVMEIKMVNGYLRNLLDS